MKKRNRRKVLRRAKNPGGGRSMRLEQLENRQLLAVGPRLISVQPNDGDILTNNEIKDIAPRDLTLIFQEGQTINPATLDQGVRLTRSGFDGVFDNGNDVIITPGFIGPGDQPNHVVMRFVETLPDDKYRLELFAVDRPTAIPPAEAIRNTDTTDNPLGEPLVPAVAGTDRDTLLFELDLGAQVIAVVPQPITRNANGSLSQAENQIVVYFNDDDLDEASAEFPEFYQLIYTRDTVSNNDDLFFNPTTVVYDAAADTATLTFAAPLHALAATVEPALAGKASTFRLRIGTEEVAPERPVIVQVGGVTSPKQGFDIDLVFPDDSVAPQFQAAMRQAADRWEQIITADLPAVGTIDDIQIMVFGLSGPNSDGPGGFFGTAIPTALRPDSRLPWRGLMQFDVDDLLALTDPRNSGTGNHLVDEMTHQIAHVLGFGELWQTFRLIANTGSTDPRYTGQAALAQYNRVFGRNELSIPIESNVFSVPIPNNEFGEKTIAEIRERHWRESVFRNELMSSRLIDRADLDDPLNPQTPTPDDDDDYNGIDDDNPLSVITIGAMADLGYTVDYSKADFYKPVPTVDAPPPPAPPVVGGGSAADINIAQEPGSRFGDHVALELDTGLVIQVTGPGATIRDEATFRIVGNNGASATFEFNRSGGLSNPAHRGIVIAGADSPATVATKIRDAINAAPGLGVTASLSPTDNTRVVVVGDQEITLGPAPGGVILDRFTSSLLVRSSIDPQHFPLDLPGAADEPGHRHIEPEQHIRNNAKDVDDIIPTFHYNFKSHIGFDPQGNALSNVITDRQKQRARDIFEIFSHLYGVQFVETASQGFTIATGDIRAIDPTVPTGPGGVLALSHLISDTNGNALEPLGGGIVIMDNAETWDDNFGGNWFQTAMNEIGQLLGLGFSTELPALTLGSSQLEGPTGVPNPDVGDIGPVAAPEPVFPGDHDIVHGRHLYRPQQKDIDLYRFTVEQTGLFTAETFAERLPNSSSLDTYMVLYRENANGTRDLIARNDDYYSEDSYIELELEPGTYYIAVTASGNNQFDPTIADTGFGGTSEGKYELRMTLRPQVRSALLDDTGTRLDGDADGRPGGVHNFWFRTAPPIDRLQPNGTIINPNPRDPKVIFVDKANQPPVTAPPPTGDLENPFNTITAAFNYIASQRAQVSPLLPTTPYIVRIVGNPGGDRNPATLGDNLPYQIGFAPTTGAALADGGLLNVPQDVTMMIDEGAIFKVRLSSINVGSESPTVDRSGGAVQVLGTPNRNVIFTSYNDEAIGVDTNPNVPQTPQAGDWGGLLFRRDHDLRESQFDWERRGIFLNHVNHADIRYGGGKVSINSIDQTVSPVEMIESRPTISFNTITRSADAALAADPNSFEETNFHAPQSQFADSFTSDYQRVGPDVHGNRVLNNSKNGLFIRIPTGTEQTVSGRWDDTDIPHLLSQTLVLAGTPGGAYLDQVPPPTNLVTFPNSVTPGSLTPGDRYLYRITFVDRNGFESPPSAIVPSPTDNPPSATVRPAGSIQINGIPQATGDYVGRRIYRLSRPLANDNPATPGIDERENDAGAASLLNVPYILVAELDRTDTVYVDTGAEIGFRQVLGNRATPPIGGILDASINAVDGIHRPRFDARLAIDPGTIVKLEGARIQANIGTQFLAEGTREQKVIFTSQRDDRYGGSGTFDTNNDARASSPAAGNWGGLVFNHSSSASIDHALITYGGGVTALGQSFSGFNVIEIHQAEARITNTVIENNANGKGGQLGNTSRLGLGTNAPATIFVRGAQPIIVSNIIRNNGGPAISINANALNATLRLDHGRSRGLADRFTQYQRNAGPLLQENRLANSTGNATGLNGIEVRGGILTTQSVWDDTDIVHVLRDRIYIPDFHTSGGLRLESDANESLVVKLFGAQAGFTATGNALDINDRIGGMLHIVGQPGFPVVLTSLRDDSVGAGFTPEGLPQNDTNGDAGTSQPAPGDWRSVEISRYAHDRNVEIILEQETEDAAAPGTNATPAAAESLGSLAPHEKAGDDNLRLGFQVHGILNAPNDVDVYSFKARPGTEVWIDVDRTTHALDTVIELIDSTGTILAQSNNSYYEGIGAETIFENNPATGDITDANVLQKSLFRPKDHFTSNPRDAGFRIVLPGAPNLPQLPTYHVRIRSSNVDKADVDAGTKDYSDLRDPNKLGNGLTSGQYEFQIRLREIDEFPGSTVRFADIRYATNGIQLTGQPTHSPLIGEAVEIVANTPTGDNNNDRNSADPVGNLLESDRAAISIGGVLSLAAGTDVDFYRFTVNYENVQRIGGFTNPIRHMPVVFDLDYADGLARGNTRLAVFDAQGRLILVADDSNVAEDRPEPLNGADVDNLDRGSVGSLDPFIGPVELPEGTYYVAVSARNRMPTSLNQFTQAGATEALLRLEPISSLTRIVEDRLGGPIRVEEPPQVSVLLNDGRTRVDANNIPVNFDSRVSFHLGDVTLYVSRDTNNVDQMQVLAVNPFTGVTEYTVGTAGIDARDIVLNPQDSKLYAFFTDLEGGDQIDDADAGRLFRIDPGTGAATLVNDDGIQTYDDGTNNRSNAGAGIGYHFEANSFGLFNNALHLFAVGNRPGFNVLRKHENILYMFTPAGVATSGQARDRNTNDPLGSGAGTNIVERGRLRTQSSIAVQGMVAPGATYTINVLRDDLTVLDSVSYMAAAGDTATNVIAGLLSAWQARQAATTGAGVDSFIASVGQDVGTGPGPGMLQDVLDLRFIDQGRLRLSTSGNLVNLGNGFGPGGTITGLSYIQGQDAMYAVSDEGGVWRVNNYNAYGGIQGTQGASTTFIANLFDPVAGFGGPQRLPFQGLTAGPVNAEGGRYANLLFAITGNAGFGPGGGGGASGRIVAFDPNHPVPGTLEPVFNNAGNDTPTILRTGITNAEGLEFSNLDFNLWHQTRLVLPGDPFRHLEAGHGTTNAFDLSGGGALGETSFHFSYAGPGLAASAHGLNNIGQFMPNVGHNYDFAGGAHGSLESNTFSLAGYVAEDRPVLYFTYFLNSEDPPTTEAMRDAFRVFAADDSGDWVLLSTNNSARNPLEDLGLTPVQVQEAFDNTNTWRQVRVDLSPFAGKENIRLRFDFSTAGSMNVGAPGTRGDELRAIDGKKLRDQMYLAIESAANGTPTGVTTQFEVDTGYTLVAPSGAKINDGDHFTIDGVTYEFDDETPGSGPNNGVTPGRIEIPYTVFQTAEEIARNMQVAIEVNYTPEALIATALEMAGQPSNDTLQSAVRTNLVMGSGTYTVTGNIGDNPNLMLDPVTEQPLYPNITPDRDVDVYQFRVPERARITLTTDTTAFPGTGVDTLIELYDARGNLVGSNNNISFFNTDSRLVFQAGSPTANANVPPTQEPNDPGFVTPAGYYYVVVRGANAGFGGQGTIDPFREASGPGNRSTGDYQLRIQIDNPDAPGTPGPLTAGGTLDYARSRNSIEVPYTFVNTVLDGNRINIPGARNITASTNLAPDPRGYPFNRFIEGRAGVTDSTTLDGDPAHVRIPLRADMSDIQVADTIAHILADVYNNGDRRLVKTFDEIVRIIENRVVDRQAAPPGETIFQPAAQFGFAGGQNLFNNQFVLPGDTFGAYSSNLRAQNNVFEGVYIDDFVIGFAERGEMATGATVDVGTLANGGYSPDPQAPANQVLQGPYQLELRRGTDFGKSTVVPGRQLDIERNFDTNHRLEHTVSLEIPAGWNIKEGQTFRLSDGVKTLTFEFDDVDLGIGSPFFDPAFAGVAAGHVRVPFSDFEPADVVAERVRDAINSAQVQDVLKITASLADGTVTGLLSTSAVVNLYGNVVGNVPDNRTPGVYNPFDFGDISVRVYGVNQTPQTVGGVTTTNNIEHDYLGDSNHFRDQGLIYVHSNQISRASQFAVNFGPGQRGAEAGEDNPHPGPVRVLREINDERLVPSAVIENNVIFRNGVGGIRFSGEPAGTQLAPVPFGRIINNTIVGDPNLVGSRTGVGVRVENGASPTLLNNIVAYLNLGIDVAGDPISATTVVGGTLYYDNTTDAAGVATGGGLGDDAIVVPVGDPLFVDPLTNNFYLALGSAAIDSGINSLGDRDAMDRVRSPLGIALSPILAPEFDAFGQLRVDDPVVNPPAGGSGQTPFIDRGALDRADLVGINAFLLNPRDNDAEGLDRDPNVTVVRRPDGVFTEFLIQLNDGPSAIDPQDGVGVDDASVTPESVTITENGRRMVLGVDYRFAYDATNNVIRITPIAGIFRPGSVFVITLNNTDKFFINAFNGAQVSDGQNFFMTDANGNRVEFEYESGYSLFVPQTLEIAVPATGGGTGGVQDRDRFTITVGAQTVTFEFDLNGGGVSNPANVPIVFTPNDTAGVIAQKIVDALNAANLGLAPKVLPNPDNGMPDLNPDDNNRVHIGATATTTLNVTPPAQTRLVVRGQARPLIDGNNFTIDRGRSGLPPQVVSFEFDSDPDPGNLLDATRTRIPFSIADSTADITRRIIAAIINANLGLTPVDLGDGHIHVGGTVDHILDTTQSTLSESGLPGARRAFGIQVPLNGAGQGGIGDGQTFIISDGLNSVTFEFDNNNAANNPNNFVIPFLNTDSADTVADRLVAAIGNANLGLSPVRVPRSVVELRGATVNHSLNLQGAGSLTQVGDPGVPPAIPVTFTPSASFADSAMAIAILNAVENALAQGLLSGVTVVTRGPEVTLTGIDTVSPGTSGTVSQFVRAIQDIAGNDLQPNQPAGETRFTIQLGGADLDFGDAPDGSIANPGGSPFNYPTRFGDNGARHVIVPGPNRLFLGAGVDADADGQPGRSALGDDADHRIGLGTSPLTLATRAPFSITVPAAGGTAFTDGQTFTITRGGVTAVTFEFNKVGNVSDPSHVRIDISNADNAATVATKIADAVRSRNATLGMNPIVFNGNSINLGGTSQHAVNLAASPLTPTPVAPAALTTPGAAAAIQLPQVLSLIVPAQGGKTGGIEDGERFVMTDATGSVTFEFDSNNSVSQTSTLRRIAFTAASTKEEIAAAIVQAINSYQTGVRSLGVTPQHLGGGVVHIGGPTGLSINVTNTTVTRIGTASPIGDGHRFTLSDGAITRSFKFGPGGAAADFTIPFDASTTLDQYATRVVAAVSGSGLNLRASNLGNGVVEFDMPANGSVNVGGAPTLTATGQPGGVADGDIFTIESGGAVFTFEFDRNGAVASGRVPVTFSANSTGAAIATAIVAAIESVSLPVAPVANGATVELAGDDEDGVIFNGRINPFVDTPVTVIASQAGLLDAWIDFNRDGDWNDPGEKIFDRAALTAGANQLVFRASTSAIVSSLSPTYARFRLSSLGGLEPFGLASDGEVEDYLVNLEPGAPAMARNDPDPNRNIHDPLHFRTSEDDLLTSPANLFANDFDPDGNPFTLVTNVGNTFQTTSALGATVVVNANGTFSYNPTTSTVLQRLDVGQSRTDTFTYRITDGDFTTSPLSVGTVTITVTGANDPPTPGADPDPVLHNPDNFTTDEDTILSFNPQVSLLVNDTDPEGDTVTFVRGPVNNLSAAGAAVVVQPDGQFRYDPTTSQQLQALAANQTFLDTFTYVVRDSRGLEATGTVTITVLGVNDPITVGNDPGIANDPNYRTTEDDILPADASVRNLLANDDDPEGNLSVIPEVIFSNRGATVTLNADGTFIYDPTGSAVLQALRSGESVADFFAYTATDGQFNATATATIVVTGVNDAPTAVNDPPTPNANFRTTEDQVIPRNFAVNLFANDSDPEGDPFQLVAFTARSAKGAIVEVFNDGTFTFDPRLAPELQALAPGASTTDTFTYTISDGDKAATATVSILVTGTNDDPIARNDPLDPNAVPFPPELQTNEDTPRTIPAAFLLANDLDPEGGATLSIAGFDLISLAGAEITFNPATGLFTYNPTRSAQLQALTAGTSFDDKFTYTVTDGNDVSLPATVTVRVSGVNDPPRANPDTVVTETAIATRIRILDNDTDPDSPLNPASVQILDAPDHGSFFLDPTDGSITYQSDTQFTGSDSFTYRVADSTGLFSQPATVTITVNPRLHPWQNPANNLDVSGDGLVTILDALLVVNVLRDFGNPTNLRTTPGGPAPNRKPFVDPSGDDVASIGDILLIVNHLRGQLRNPEPEGEGEAPDDALATVQLAQATGVIDAGATDGAFPGYHVLTDINSESYFRRLDAEERGAALATYADERGTAPQFAAASAMASSPIGGAADDPLGDDDDTLDLDALDAIFEDGFSL